MSSLSVLCCEHGDVRILGISTLHIFMRFYRLFASQGAYVFGDIATVALGVHLFEMRNGFRERCFPSDGALDGTLKQVSRDDIFESFAGVTHVARTFAMNDNRQGIDFSPFTRYRV